MTLQSFLVLFGLIVLLSVAVALIARGGGWNGGGCHGCGGCAGHCDSCGESCPEHPAAPPDPKK